MINNITITRIAICAILSFVLISCASKSDSPINENGANFEDMNKHTATFSYDCATGDTVTATISDNYAWLFLPYDTVKLQLRPSASGAKFSNGNITYWSKGQEAVILTVNGDHIHCINDRQKAVWEHAKLKGVDFRAVGNEPGWHLELGPKQIVYTGDYGNTVYSFPAAPPSTDVTKRQTVYESTNTDTDIRILIEGKECSDTMSDIRFESTVTIWVDNNVLHGCGRSLH